MKWLIFITFAIFFWAFCDIFLKKGVKDIKGKYFNIKCGITTGFVFFILSIVYLLLRNEPISIWESMITYYPVTLFGLVYVIVNIIYFKSYRYNEVSINSFIANTSGIIGVIVLIILYLILGKVDSVWDILDIYKIISLILIIIGIILIAKIRKGIFFKKKTYVGYPIMYSSMDAIKTVIVGLAVNTTLGYSMPSMDVAIIYGFIYGITALILWIYLYIKERKIYNPFNKKSTEIILGEFSDSFALLFYTMAASIDAVFTDCVILLYPVVVMLLSKVYLKEKLNKKQKVALGIILLGMLFIIISELK